METLYNLPPEVLQIIFSHLDNRSLLSATETCQKFQDVISHNDCLLKKLTLHLLYPQELKEFAASMNASSRRYRILHITKSRDKCYGNVNPAVKVIEPLFTHLGGMIHDLKIDWMSRGRDISLFEIMNRQRNARGGVRGVQRGGRAWPGNHHFFDEVEEFNYRGRLQRALPANQNQNADNFNEELEAARADIYNEFVSIIKHFGKVESLHILNVQHLDRGERSNDTVTQFPQLRKLVTEQCDDSCFELLSSCTQLTTLDIKNPCWNTRRPGIYNFEDFLVKQKDLRHLALHNIYQPSLFLIDRSPQIEFKLHTLRLRNVFFNSKDIAVNFFRTQTELRQLELQLQNKKSRALDEVMFYNQILRTIVTSCRSLETLIIAKIRYKLLDLDFIAGSRNHSVKTLEFKVTAEDNSPNLFKAMLKMFPNLKAVSFKAEESEDTDCGICFDEGTVLDSVEKLVVLNSSVRSLVNVFAPSLTSFEYAPGKTGEFVDDQFGGFFHRHRNIKHLTIGSCSGRSYFFVSYNLCELICNFLTQIESISIYNFGEVNKSVKLLCKLQKLKTLTLSTEDFQQFTAKTKVECARNDLFLNVTKQDDQHYNYPMDSF